VGLVNMKGFEDEEGQLILIACVIITITIVLIISFEYSTLVTGEKSIKRENMNSVYYYESVRDRYVNIYNEQDYEDNLDMFENEIKALALLHGYSVDFVHNNSKTTIVFVDKDMRIEEELPYKGVLH
jgi:hypothetical protein